MPTSLLLNWRTYVVLAVFLSYAFVYRKGQESIQVDFDLYKNEQLSSALKADQAARAKEAVLNQANLEVTSNYEALKSATATAVRSLDADRLRLQASLSHTVSGGTTTIVRADESSKDRILGECIDYYSGVAGDAEGLSNQVEALQKYIQTVVPKQQ